MPATRHAVIPPDALERVGRALYGDQWIAAVARDLKMSRRSVEYMRSGQRGIKAAIVYELIDVVQARGRELYGVATELQDAVRRPTPSP
jgi:hypothetical protein